MNLSHFSSSLFDREQSVALIVPRYVGPAQH